MHWARVHDVPARRNVDAGARRAHAIRLARGRFLAPIVQPATF
jgi:hypothetical protein